MQSAITIEELNAFFLEAFPGDIEFEQEIVFVENGRSIIQIKSSPKLLRPGGYFSGPTQMSLADKSSYAAVFTRLGIVPMAVTSNLNINFLRPCIGDAAEAEASIVKCGKFSIVLEAKIRAVGSRKVASHAMVTYARPNNPQRF